jgi:Ca2+-binding RTX toxin-like protein
MADLIKWVSNYARTTYGTEFIISANLDNDARAYFPDLGSYVVAGYYQNALFHWNGNGTVTGEVTSTDIAFLTAQGINVLNMDRVGTGESTTQVTADNYDSQITTANFMKEFLWAMQSGSTPYMTTLFPDLPYAEFPHFVRLNGVSSTLANTQYKDWVIGNALDNVISTGAGDDAIYGGGGNNTIDGGTGTDTLVTGGIVTQYQFGQNGGNIVVTGRGGADTLTGVEYIGFGSSNYTTDVPLSDAATGNPAHMAKQIADLYVAYFDRAPEAEGFDYWFHEIYTAVKGLRVIAENFAGSTEYQSVYPDTLTNSQFVERIYQNLFDREPEQGGWDYWSGQLETGSVHRSDFILDVIEGAYASTSGPEDRALIDNKHDAALYYTDRLATLPQEGFDNGGITSLLNLVTGDVSTVAASERVIDYAFNNTITLTGVMADHVLLDSLWASA